MADEQRIGTVAFSRNDIEPSLLVQPDGAEASVVMLIRERMHIGSDSRQEIALPYPGVAPRMARITREGKRFHFQSMWMYPADVTVNGKMSETVPLTDGDVIRLQNGTGHGVTLTFRNPAEKSSANDELRSIPLEKTSFIIGRAPDSDLLLPSLAVSWHQATISKDGGAHTLRDENSLNGTFVNDQRLTAPHRLKMDDVIRIDKILLVYKGDALLQLASTQRFELDAHDLQVEFTSGVINRKTAVTLRDVSIAINPGEFVAIIGGSGSGKSTLLRALNGANPAAHGRVLINGDDLYQEYATYQSIIGYVPQKDIVNEKLTVYESLLFGAQLRFPNEPAPAREQRIERALAIMSLGETRNLAVGRLSGGQKKRVSTALELLAEPQLLFLDEPSSGLDPGLDRLMMETLRRLANQGATVLIVTHTTLNIDICDKLLFVSKGRLVYYGPPKDGLSFFDVRDYTEIYNKVEQSPFGALTIDAREAANQWAERYEKSSHYDKHIRQRLKDASDDNSELQEKILNRTMRRSRTGSFWQQLSVVTARTAVLARRDFKTLIALLVVLPMIGLFLGFINPDPLGASRGMMLVDRFAGMTQDEIDTLLSETVELSVVGDGQLPQSPADSTESDSDPTTPTGDDAADSDTGDDEPESFSLGGAADDTPPATEEPAADALPFECATDEVGIYNPAGDAQRLLFILSLAVALVGIFASAYTIVEERTLFLREHLANLRVMPYLMAKFVVYGGLTLFSAALALLMLSIGVELPAQGLLLWGPLEIFITLALTALVGVSIGLFISAVSRQINAVTYFVLAVLFMQILLPGVLFEMNGALEAPARATVTRWTLEALGTTTQMNARSAEGRFVVRNTIVVPDTCEVLRVETPAPFPAPSALSFTYPDTQQDLLVRWAILLGINLVFVMGANLALQRDESF